MTAISTASSSIEASSVLRRTNAKTVATLVVGRAHSVAAASDRIAVTVNVQHERSMIVSVTMAFVQIERRDINHVRVGIRRPRAIAEVMSQLTVVHVLDAPPGLTVEIEQMLPPVMELDGSEVIPDPVVAETIPVDRARVDLERLRTVVPSDDASMPTQLQRVVVAVPNVVGPGNSRYGYQRPHL